MRCQPMLVKTVHILAQYKILLYVFIIIILCKIMGLLLQDMLIQNKLTNIGTKLLN